MGLQVIQKLIERVSPERLGFVCTFRGNVYELATHPYGCRVLQRCLEHLPEEYTRPLLDEMHNYTPSLMQDQFGVRLSDVITALDSLSYPRIMSFSLLSSTGNLMIKCWFSTN